MFTEDLADFFDTDEFAVDATYTKAGGGASSVTGIRDREFLAALMVESSSPMFLMPLSSLPSGAAHGDALVVGSDSYTVRGIHRHPDGFPDCVLLKLGEA